MHYVEIDLETMHDLHPEAAVRVSSQVSEGLSDTVNAYNAMTAAPHLAVSPVDTGSAGGGSSKLSGRIRLVASEAHHLHAVLKLCGYRLFWGFCRRYGCRISDVRPSAG